MYDRIRPRLGVPDNTAMLGYPINAEFHLHVHDMIRITVAWVFDNLYPDDRWKADLAMSVDSLVGKHWKPDLKALLENVAPDGSPMLDLPEGRMVHPGHAIESAWMLMEIAWRNGNAALMDTAIEIALASLEHGWDKEYGGIRYITNLDWTPMPPAGSRPEALVAALRGALCAVAGLGVHRAQRRRPMVRKGPRLQLRAILPIRSSANGSATSTATAAGCGPPRPTGGRGASTCPACCSAATSCCKGSLSKVGQAFLSALLSAM